MNPVSDFHKGIVVLAVLALPGSHTCWLHAEEIKLEYDYVLQTVSNLWAYEHAGRPESRYISFEFPESVINVYLSISLKLNPRPGLNSASVECLPDNRVIVTADMDFQRLIREDPGIIPPKLRPRFLRAGPVKAEFHFLIESAQLTFTVKSVPSSSVDTPASVLERIVRRLAIMQPEKFDTTRPIPLPFGLKRVYSGKNVLSGETGRTRVATDASPLAQ